MVYVFTGLPISIVSAGFRAVLNHWILAPVREVEGFQVFRSPSFPQDLVLVQITGF